MSDKTSTFTVHAVGENSGDRFDGQFTTRNVLSFRQQLDRDQTRRRLLGEVPAGTVPVQRVLISSEMLAELSVRVVDSPKWWRDSDNGIDLEDDEVLVEVYNKTMAKVAEYDAAKRGDGGKAQGDLAKNQPPKE